MKRELRALGLTKNESIVYEGLAKYGPIKAGQLISKLALHRNTIYQTLENLISKGYAAKISSRGVWQFQITEPESLLSTIRQKEKLFESVVDEIKLLQTHESRQFVVYEGIDSYRNYWIESLKRVPAGTIDYTAIAPPNLIWQELMGKQFDQYQSLRVKKGIIWKSIHRQITAAEIQMLDEYPDITEYRIWQKTKLPDDFIGNFNVVHDTVILHATETVPRIIEIRDPAMVKIFRGYFDMMWEISEPVN